MNQGKLEMVKQEMARVNVDILGIRELKWTGWVNLNKMTIISTTIGKNPLQEMEQLSYATRVRNAVLGCNLKNDRMIPVHFQGKLFNITIIQVYALTSNAEEADGERLVLRRHTRPSRTNTKKRCPFYSSGLE